MGPDYDSICQKAQQSIDRDKGRIAELAATVDEKQGLLDALRSCMSERDEWKQKYFDENQKYTEEHKMRIAAEENLAAERERPLCYMDKPDIKELFLGDKNITTYAENNSLEGLPNQRISLGQQKHIS